MTSIAQVIPQDIVQEIFVHIGGEDIVWLDVEHPKYFPWYLGHICSQWRITLLSMPPRGLKAGKHQRNKELTMNIVTYFLEWKRGHQFDLVLSCYCWSQENIWTDMVDLLVAESARWRHVTLNICTRACGIPALYRVKDHLPSMQSLRLIGMYCQPKAPKNGHPRDIFTNIPSLTHIRLPWMSWNWGFDWSNLTHLHLEDMLSKGCQSIICSLRQAINLNTLVTGALSNTSYMAERVTLPHLESWHVLDYRWLGCIKAPALQNLYLHGGGKIEINVVISFLRESGCKLQSLTLFYIQVGEDHRLAYLVEILRHVPELVHLKVFDEFAYNIADSIESINAPILSDLVGPELPAPRLQSLQVVVKFHHYAFTDRFVYGLSQLVLLRNGQAKTNGGRPLKSLIVGEGEISDESLRTLCEACRVELRLIAFPGLGDLGLGV